MNSMSNNIVTLKQISTRELIRALRSTYQARLFKQSQESEDEEVFVATRFVKGGVEVGVFATHAQIREELKTRPHIPSKKEGKVLRRLKHKTGMTYDQLRKHSKYGQEVFDSQLSAKRRELDDVPYNNILRRIVSVDKFMQNQYKLV